MLPRARLFRVRRRNNRGFGATREPKPHRRVIGFVYGSGRGCGRGGGGGGGGRRDGVMNEQCYIARDRRLPGHYLSRSSANARARKGCMANTKPGYFPTPVVKALTCPSSTSSPSSRRASRALVALLFLLLLLLLLPFSFFLSLASASGLYDLGSGEKRRASPPRSLECFLADSFPVATPDAAHVFPSSSDAAAPPFSRLSTPIVASLPLAKRVHPGCSARTSPRARGDLSLELREEPPADETRVVNQTATWASRASSSARGRAPSPRRGSAPSTPAASRG